MFICNTDNDFAKETAYIDKILSRRVEGLLLAPTPDPRSEDHLSRLRTHDLKFVVIHRRLQRDTAEVVRVDGESAARALTSDLIKAGRRRIGFLGLPFTDSTSMDRLAGYKAALRRAGIPYDLNLVREGDVEDGRVGAGPGWGNWRPGACWRCRQDRLVRSRKSSSSRRSTCPRTLVEPAGGRHGHLAQPSPCNLRLHTIPRWPSTRRTRSECGMCDASGHFARRGTRSHKAARTS